MISSSHGELISSITTLPMDDGKHIGFVLKHGAREHSFAIPLDLFAQLLFLVPDTLQKAKDHRQTLGIPEPVRLDEQQPPQVLTLSQAEVLLAGQELQMRIELFGVIQMAIRLSAEQAAKLSKSLRKPKSSARLKKPH